MPKTLSKLYDFLSRMRYQRLVFHLLPRISSTTKWPTTFLYILNSVLKFNFPCPDILTTNLQNKDRFTNPVLGWCCFFPFNWRPLIKMTIWAYIAGFLSFCYIIWNVFFIRIVIFFIIAIIKYKTKKYKTSFTRLKIIKSFSNDRCCCNDNIDQ